MEQKRKDIRMAVLILINIWVREFSIDFRDAASSFVKTTKLFLTKVSSNGVDLEESQVACINLEHLMFIPNTKIGDRQSSRCLNRLEDLMEAMPLKEKKFDKVKAKSFAQQITLLHFAIYQKIETREFLKTGWTKKDKKQRSPTIVMMTEHFDGLARFVQRTIVFESDIRKRAQTFTKWLEIGQECFLCQNYHGAGAIYAGLSSNAVHRMKKTKEQVGKKMKLYDMLHTIIKRDGNSRAYRELLEKSFSSCVPYLPTFFGDLEKTETANDNSILGMINFNKHQMRQNVIIKVMRFQTQMLNYAKIKVNPDIQHLLFQVLTPMDKAQADEFENRMWEASLKSEPRDPPPEQAV
mmetsp:Transcript_2675/g.4924  ORF Transcript_2675/g.4924 Transcript_2675/m.4924 type:complete len:352 (-) Transcript_2675:173-1228(-)|eukprot:CAMPEP_0197517534 /NCGR_PEP_ID=MMETSP1318-20131121/2574_1 /TAXON_ID=552666 /ORGANISM="Partenskyella glossopodia, Strain RCC365" /LENGTH=351 /DNA_ID=CAMNT_0043067181 /DNA_START=45 /DNA_END=1100 /DNA_ORIENTATION=-